MKIKIGDIIANAIEINNLKQKEVARALKIPYTTFNNYVCNKRIPDMETTFDILQYLNVDINKLLNIKDNDHLIMNKEEAKIIHLFRSTSPEVQKKLVVVMESLVNTFKE